MSKFADKHPVAQSIIIAWVLFFLPQFVSQVPLYICETVTGRDLNLAGSILTILTACTAFYLYKLRFRPLFKGTLAGSMKEGLLLGLPILLYWAATMIIALVSGNFAFKGISTGIIYTSVIAGFMEELAWRHGMISTLLRKWDTTDKIVPAVCVSAVIFGMVHALNALAGADLFHTFLQVAESTMIGIFFGAIFLRSGSLLTCMIIHTVHDIYAIAISPEVEASGLITGSITLVNILDLFLCIILGAVGLYYLSPKFRDGIVTLWDRIWSRTDSYEQ